MTGGSVCFLFYFSETAHFLVRFSAPMFGTRESYLRVLHMIQVAQGLFRLMLFQIISLFSKIINYVVIFSLLPNFSNVYKILTILY